MGGNGVLNYLEYSAEHVTKALIIAGHFDATVDTNFVKSGAFENGLDAAQCDRIITNVIKKKIPMWFLHAQNDTVCSFEDIMLFWHYTAEKGCTTKLQIDDHEKKPFNGHGGAQAWFFGGDVSLSPHPLGVFAMHPETYDDSEDFDHIEELDPLAPTAEDRNPQEDCFAIGDLEWIADDEEGYFCLLCKKWATWPRTHGGMDHEAKWSNMHRKKMHVYREDPAWREQIRHRKCTWKTRNRDNVEKVCEEKDGYSEDPAIQEETDEATPHSRALCYASDSTRAENIPFPQRAKEYRKDGYFPAVSSTERVEETREWKYQEVRTQAPNHVQALPYSHLVSQRPWLDEQGRFCPSDTILVVRECSDLAEQWSNKWEHSPSECTTLPTHHSECSTQPTSPCSPWEGSYECMDQSGVYMYQHLTPSPKYQDLSQELGHAPNADIGRHSTQELGHCQDLGPLTDGIRHIGHLTDGPKPYGKCYPVGHCDGELQKYYPDCEYKAVCAFPSDCYVVPEYCEVPSTCEVREFTEYAQYYNAELAPRPPPPRYLPPTPYYSEYGMQNYDYTPGEMNYEVEFDRYPSDCYEANPYQSQSVQSFTPYSNVVYCAPEYGFYDSFQPSGDLHDEQIEIPKSEESYPPSPCCFATHPEFDMDYKDDELA